MITYEDCLALADLAPETVDQVAARAGLTPIAEGERGGCRAITVARPAASRARGAPARSRTGRLAA
jgi:hypothetical protein